MNEIKISIIVPVYNVANYLKQCVESILNQTFTDWELILVDDGSSDNSGHICDEYIAKDSRIRVFHKINGGVSSARNLGIDEAKGKWITFIDSDDYILPNFLEGLYQPIADGENVDFVHGGCQNLKGDQLISINQSYEYYIGNESTILFTKLRGLTISKLFCLENIKHRPDGFSLRFDEKMRMAEDMAFTLDYILFVNRYAFVSEIGYCYRIDNMQSATKSKKIEKYETALHSFRHLYNSIRTYIQRYQLSEEVSRLRLSYEAIHLRNVCLLLYYNNYSRGERLFHLKNDFEDEHLALLNITRTNRFYSFLFSFLENRRFHLFDAITSLMVLIKKIRNMIRS